MDLHLTVSQFNCDEEVGIVRSRAMPTIKLVNRGGHLALVSLAASGLGSVAATSVDVTINSLGTN